MVQPSLLKALFKAYGLPYLLLGIIKLVNDILNFAGPLLLNVLIRYLETTSEPFDLDPHKAAKGNHQRPWWLPQPDSLAFGLCCAGLLGITSLIKVCMHLTCLLQHVTNNIQEASQDYQKLHAMSSWTHTHSHISRSLHKPYLVLSHAFHCYH